MELISKERLTGRVALVTGASTGIGAAVARRFATAGAHVVVNFRHSHDAAESVADAIRANGGQATLWQADMGDAGAINEMIDELRSRLGRIDVLATIAGADILTGAAAAWSDVQKLEQLLRVDLQGTMHCCWKLAPLMQQTGAGSIVTMAWDLALHGMEGRNSEMFAAVKAGVVGFSKSLARSYAPEVRVNIVAPGWIETAFIRDDMPREARDAVLAKTPLRRFGLPEDVADAALFLASDESAFITGQTLYVNGGLAT